VSYAPSTTMMIREGELSHCSVLCRARPRGRCSIPGNSKLFFSSVQNKTDWGPHCSLSKNMKLHIALTQSGGEECVELRIHYLTRLHGLELYLLVGSSETAASLRVCYVETLTTWHPLFAKGGTNFADKRK
jgi:hypothetical protein